MDDPCGSLIRVFVLLIMFLIGSLAYGYEAAFEKGSFPDPDDEEEGKSSGRPPEKLLCSPERLSETVRTVGAIILIVLSLYEVPFFARGIASLFAGSKTPSGGITVLSYAAAAFLLGWLFLAVCVRAPRKIAPQKIDRWMRKYSGLMSFLSAVLRPITILTAGLSNPVVRIFRADPLADNADVTEEEIISMVDEGHEKGVFQDSEVEMIHNIFDLNDTDAKDIMTHRKNIVAIDGSMTLAEARPQILEQGYSRFPVFREDIDDLIGILHIRNLLQCEQQEEYRGKPLSEIPELLHSVFYIPETRSIDVLFRSMQQDKNHMAIVIDEYGQTSGLVTLEDILEEIVGSIQDEYDEEEEPIVPCGESSYLIQGFTQLEDIEEELDVAFDDEEHETLNGYLIARIDRIPQDGEQLSLSFDGMRFQILKVDNNAIRSVLVTKLPKKTEDDETEM